MFFLSLEFWAPPAGSLERPRSIFVISVVALYIKVFMSIYGIKSNFFKGYIDVISMCNIVNNSMSNGFGDNS